MTAASGRFDAVVIGAGMAGASLAAELSADMSVLLVEMEDQPGYHATGRSVAFWSESYGGPQIRPLTRASWALLNRPDPEFSDEAFLSDRGAVHIGRAGDLPLCDAMQAEFADDSLFVALDADALRRRIPALRTQWVAGLDEPSTRDIDVAALHAAYLRAFHRRGGALLCASRFEGGYRDAAGTWQIALSTGAVQAAILVNAAGAWADDVARAVGVAALGIRPMLRTVVQLRVDPVAPDDLPLVMDLAGNFYFKPASGGRIWLSPHDEQPAVAGDVAPDEIDVAVAIERFQSVVDWRIEAVERKWAGLRSFSPDRLPVYGFDPREAGFFWFAGQGGFGIQTAPAAARLARSIITGEDDPAIASLNAGLYTPARFADSCPSQG